MAMRGNQPTYRGGRKIPVEKGGGSQIFPLGPSQMMSCVVARGSTARGRAEGAVPGEVAVVVWGAMPPGVGEAT